MPNLISELIGIQPGNARPVQPRSRSILLLRPPYFTPWTPPLGIGILKSFLNSHGHRARCFDFNADPELWGMHHRYFSLLAASSGASTNDGYSRLWWIVNAHMLASANGASAAAQRRVIESISPLYGVHVSRATADALIPLIDHYFSRLTHLFDQLDLSDYEVVGTSTYTTSLSSSLWLLKRAKKKYPGLTTVMGGGVFADDLALGSDNLQILLQEYPWVDHVILGEGELLLQKLLDGELAHKRVLSLPDLQGATLKMEDVPAPDFSDFDMSRYYNLTIEGARSCPFQCSFCSETIQWGEYRKKPIDKLVDQIIGMADSLGMREVFLGDSLMNPYLIPFAESLMKQGANILYDGYLRADRPVTKEKFVKLWAQSGLYRVRLGIESASDRVLKSMDKMTTAAVISDVLKTLSRAGIRTTTYWIVGYSGETEEDFQETCDFIRAHRQYIYELEAHPYYYYPYGQVGSRLHQCESTYPEDVTDLTRFKMWEIIGSDPPREVRYQRLDRISQLAAELGLPNIYTMTERYQAEDRWRSLHPLAREVFKNADREEISPFVAAHPPLAEQGKTEAAIRYRLSVAKPLNGEVLSAALASIHAHFAVFRKTAGSVEAQVTKNSGGGDDVLLTAPHNLADGFSLVLLAEALCRSYEQILAGKDVFHRPEERVFIEHTRARPNLERSSLVDAVGITTERHLLSIAASSGVALGEGARRKAHVRFLTAALRALRNTGVQSVGVVLDPRTSDHSLAHTSGLVARIAAWTDLSGMPNEIHAASEWVSACMEKAAMSPHMDEGGVYDAVIDLEFLTELAWMGSPNWKSEGYDVITPLAYTGALEIRPVVVREGIAVEIGRAKGSETAAEVIDRLEAELVRVTAHGESLERAKLFWSEELGYAGESAATLETANDGVFEAVTIDAPACAEVDPVAALVALYALLAPRLEQVAISRVALLYENGGVINPLPIRMHESGNPKCVDFIRAAGKKVSIAEEHVMWSEVLFKRTEDKSFMAHGCLMSHAADWSELSGCRTVLDLSRGPRAARILFQKKLYGREQIENLTLAIEAVLAQLTMDQDIRIGDVLWRNFQRTSPDATVAVAELSHEFQFGD